MGLVSLALALDCSSMVKLLPISRVRMCRWVYGNQVFPRPKHLAMRGMARALWNLEFRDPASF